MGRSFARRGVGDGARSIRNRRIDGAHLGSSEDDAMTPDAPTTPLPYTPDEVAASLGSSWKETLLDAVRWMALGRALDSRMQSLQRQGRVGFYGAATGQEAVNVAAGLATSAEDWIFPGLREQLVALVRGHDLVTYVHHLFGDALDPALGRNMPCHPSAREVHYVSMSSVIGTQVSQAAGLAYALRVRRDPGVAVAFFGDGATSSNDFHAGMNFAGVFGLPVLFLCANNRWAISVPVERQTATPTLAEKAREYGLEGRRVDGTDFVAVYRALAESLHRIRHGGPAEMIEFVLFRMNPHSSSDDPGRYQPDDWLARARATDPLDRLVLWLSENGLVDGAAKGRTFSEADERVRAAVRIAESTPSPSPSTLTEGVFAPSLSTTTTETP